MKCVADVYSYCYLDILLIYRDESFYHSVTSIVYKSHMYSEIDIFEYTYIEWQYIFNDYIIITIRYIIHRTHVTFMYLLIFVWVL